MGFVDDVADIGIALGKGIYSVGEDLILGLDRTGEGLGTGGRGRMTVIGFENEYLARHLVKLVKSIPGAAQSPLTKLIVRVLERYYEKFPEDALKKLTKAAGIGAAYMGGRMVIGKKLATFVAVKIAESIAASAAYKQLAKKLGVSAAAGATGIGAVITLLMFQGVAQRASNASRRLLNRDSELWNELRREQGLDMLYFLVEKPMKPYFEAIRRARRDERKFADDVSKLYEKHVEN